MSNTMDTDDTGVLTSSAISTISVSIHPLPILNISEHLTRLKLQKNSASPFVFGALLGTQNGREVDVVNTFELALDEEEQLKINHAFLVSRRDQYKQVFPSLDFIGWYTVAVEPNSRHIEFHEQFTTYIPTPLLLMLNPISKDNTLLPLKAYEPTIEIRDRRPRTMFIEVKYTVQTGEAERIAVDWTAKGGEGGTSLEAHLQTQRAAVQMLHNRILVLVQYVSDVIAGKAQKDHAVLRALSALVSTLPASSHPEFKREFDQEYADVQLTAYLSALTNSTHALNELVDKHILAYSGSGNWGSDARFGGPTGRRRGPPGGRMGAGAADWERFH